MQRQVFAGEYRLEFTNGAGAVLSGGSVLVAEAASKIVRRLPEGTGAV